MGGATTPGGTCMTGIGGSETWSDGVDAMTVRGGVGVGVGAALGRPNGHPGESRVCAQTLVASAKIDNAIAVNVRAFNLIPICCHFAV